MGKITVRFMIQIAGKPVENVTKALDVVEKKIKESEGIKVLELEQIEPELDEETTLYSGLMEVLAKFDKIGDVLDFVIQYTPTSIIVEDPENMKLDAASLSGVLNDFSSYILKASHQIRVLNANLHRLQKNEKKA